MRRMIFRFFVAFLFGGIAVAGEPKVQSPLAGKSSEAALKKPMSLSYESVINCYPSLADERMAFRVDLKRLSERIHSTMATQNSRLIERTILFRDADDVTRRVRLVDFKGVTEKPEYRVSADIISSSGELTPWEDAPIAKTVTSPWELRGILGRSEIRRDETVVRETKLGERVLLTRKDMDRIVEITLSDFKGKDRLNCEARKDSGAVCTCLKR